jgi:hypothetical protein
MACDARRYRYVGPPEVRAEAAAGPGGAVIRSSTDFARWVAGVGAEELAEPFTYVVDVEGTLRLAPRRSEHVGCAGGTDVLAASELAVERDGEGWLVGYVSNQSTGYCPDTTSWPVVATALDGAELRHSGGFTAAFVFRRCEGCLALNVVKDGDFTCQVCGRELPVDWNVDDDPRGVVPRGPRSEWSAARPPGGDEGHAGRAGRSPPLRSPGQ